MLQLIDTSEDSQKLTEVFKDYISNLIPFFDTNSAPAEDQKELLEKWVGLGKVSFTVPEMYDGLDHLPPKWANYVRKRRKNG